MSFLNETEKSTLIEKINQAESGTRAEIVTVIARQSDGYRYIPMLWAALIALSIPGIYYAWQSFTTDGWLAAEQSATHANWLYPLQVLTFLGLGVIFQIPQARLWLIPEAVKKQRAARHAREQFFLQKLHDTTERTGILVFVSVAEHYVEIIVDSGIAEVVDNSVWDQTVQEFIDHVRRGDIATGFISTIEHCREITWKHFPAPEERDAQGHPTEQQSNQLPNHLIEV